RIAKRSGGRWSGRFSRAGSVMFTRRTATVTISAPDASIARRVSAKDAYLPVPTISRERYSRPASTKGSFMSPSPDEMDDLDPVALAERGERILGAWHHGAVHLDRDATRPEPERRDEIGDGRLRVERAGFVVHDDLHG